MGMNFTNFNSNMPQYTQKLNTQFVQQPIQTGGAVIRPQMIMNNFRQHTPPSTFPNPIQRPGLQIPANQRQPRPQIGAPVNPAQVRTSTVVAPVATSSSSTVSSSLKAQQEKQRKELLAHAQSFLNPQNKPSIKQAGKVEVSASDKKSTAKSDDGKATDKK